MLVSMGVGGGRKGALLQFYSQHPESEITLQNETLAFNHETKNDLFQMKAILRRHYWVSVSIKRRRSSS